MKRFIALVLSAILAVTISSYFFYTQYFKSISSGKIFPIKPSLPIIETEQKRTTFSTTNKLGYESLLNETKIESLLIQGTIPSWLSGSFFINGPAQFELNEKKFHYWFDGFAMIHRFSCNNGSISYANKFLKSSYYTQALKSGSLPSLLNNEEKPSFFARMKSKVTALVAKRPIYDNTNVNITSIDGKLLALTETPHHIMFDPMSLETLGNFTYEDSLDGHICTAHPIIDQNTGTLFNVLTTFGATTSTYHIYKILPNSKCRIELCSFSSPEPSYIHSFSITPHYIVLTLTPFIVNPLDLLFSTKAFIAHYKWTPERKTEFVVIDRANGSIVKKIKTDPFFVFHHSNAYEYHHSLIIDLVSYADHSIVYSAALEKLCSNEGNKKEGTLQRCILDLKKEKVVLKTIVSIGLESPHINEHYRGHAYSYTYALDASNKSVLKINVQTGTAIRWQESNCYPGEPIFVEKPNAKHEDDGVILSCVLDAHNKTSFLLILDAKTLKELGRAHVPHHIPFSFHGIFLATP